MPRLCSHTPLICVCSDLGALFSLMYEPPETLRQISSRLTFVWKFITPFATIAVAYNMIQTVLEFLSRGGNQFIVFVLVVLVAVVAHTLWIGYRIKTVKADANNLYVSNYFKEGAVPLSQIYDVTEIRWVEPRIVTIHLRSPSEFGSRIAFLAPYRFFAWYSPHPIVTELQQMRGSKNYQNINV